MLSAESKNDIAGHSSFQTFSVQEQILALSNRYADYLSRIGAPQNFSRQDLLTKMSALSLLELNEVAFNFSRALEMMDAGFFAIEKEAPRPEFSKASEIQSLLAALKKADLRLADEKFFDFLDDGDIIEVFSDQGVQLYRSWSCFQYCSYSPLELKMYDWDALYVRPSWVAKTLWQLLPKLFEPGVKTTAYGIPDYIMTERLHREKRTLLFKMKYASPLINELTGKTCAFVSTGRLSILEKAKDRPDISIL